MLSYRITLKVFFDNVTKIEKIVIALADEKRRALIYGNTIYVMFEGKVMHIFDSEMGRNLHMQ